MANSYYPIIFLFDLMGWYGVASFKTKPYFQWCHALKLFLVVILHSVTIRKQSYPDCTVMFMGQSSILLVTHILAGFQ